MLENFDAKLLGIVIGVGEYRYLDADTQYADDDARELTEQLGILWGCDHDKLVVDSCATKEYVGNIVHEWLSPKESKEDVVLKRSEVALGMNEQIKPQKQFNSNYLLAIAAVAIVILMVVITVILGPFIIPLASLILVLIGYVVYRDNSDPRYKLIGKICIVTGTVIILCNLLFIMLFMPFGTENLRILLNRWF